MLALLDIFLLLFHLVVIGFNLFGWIWKPTRRANLVVLVLTGLSWTALGIFWGWGYCPFTDWHWQVKEKLGETDLPYSYVKYYLDALTGWDWSAALVDWIIFVCFMLALGASVFVNWRDAARHPRGDAGDRPEGD